MKIALGIEYDGSQFYGWQQQTGLRTIQECVELAVSAVANHPVQIFCAGRTDAGVHASGQVVHFETDAMRSENNWLLGINSNIPKDIRVTWVKQISEDFHARFSATARQYRYFIYNTKTHPALFRHYVTWEPKNLNAEVMHEAAQCLIGEHDFSSFRSSKCQSHSPNRFIHFINIYRQDSFVIIDIKANAFLHHMVRNIAGALMAVGTEKYPIIWIADVLQAKDREKAHVTAAANGLFLMSVDYPERFEISFFPSTFIF